MNKTVLIGGKLAIICAVAAVVLGAVNAVTAPKIEQIKKERLQAALEKVSLGGTIGEAKTPEEEAPAIKTYYVVENSSGKVDYIVRIIGMGYGGEMVILGGYSEEGEIRAAKLMENQETPGLGKEAEKPSYMDKFVGTGDEKEVPTRKDALSQENADAVTGSTITFVGVAGALEKGSRFVKELAGVQ